MWLAFNIRFLLGMFETSSNPGKFCNTVLVLVSYLYMKCFVVPLQIPCVLLCPFSSSVSWQPGSQCWLPSCSVGLLPSCSALVLVGSPGRSVHSCRLPTHIFHLMFNSRSQKKNNWSPKSPKAEIYYFQSEKIRRQRVSEQIHIVSSHRQLADRQKVSFHGKFPDYYTSDHQHYSHIIPPAFTWEKAKLLGRK